MLFQLLAVSEKGNLLICSRHLHGKNCNRRKFAKKFIRFDNGVEKNITLLAEAKKEKNFRI